MIPYFKSPELHLPLGLELNGFGPLMLAGIVLGAKLAARAARRYGPGDPSVLEAAAPWAVAGGMAGGHLLHVFGYHPELLTQQGPWVVLRFWDGLSSMGGVLGALVGLFLFGWRRRLSLRPYLNALALGAAPGWAVARLGCFWIHDHPGTRTDFPLAVAFPGGARHDLGLYDALLLFALSALLYALAKAKPAAGTLMGVLAVGYSVPRFFFDFLRAEDLPFSDGRYFGLTPAQYIVVGLAGAGVWLLARGARPSPA